MNHKYCTGMLFRTTRLFASLLFLLFIYAGNAWGKTALSVSFTHEGLAIDARLVLPDGNAPYKVIIINPGTGAMDKNGTVAVSGGNFNCLYPGLVGNTVTTYKDISDALSDSGYAVLTYDKVEYTHPNPGVISFEKLWLPVHSAIQYLKTRTDIDVQNIILLGHSEGSSLIPYIAKQNSGIAALVSLAGPRQPLDTLLDYQLLYIARKCGGDTNQAKTQGAQVLQYFSDIRTGNWNGSTPPVFGVEAAVWEKYMNVVDSVSINYNIANKPTLFVGLGDDYNVPPATEIARFKDEVTITNDFYNIPGINHFVTTANNPRVSETVTDTIIYWLKGRVPPTSVKLTSANDNSIRWNFAGATLRLVSSEMIESISVTDLAGRVIISKNIQDKHAVLDFNYPAGQYILVATQGDNTSVIRLVKHY
jgi:dienelactone hydrolase